MNEGDTPNAFLKRYAAGTVIGDTYRLKELIGKGGMGYVFCAEHTLIGRDYALKIMDPGQINETNWKRFQSEGQAIAKLSHANIVSIYNMGVDREQCPYYVMDLLKGASLADLISGFGPLPQAATISIFQQLCSALSYAHQIGVVHRDIKPSNIILLDQPLKPLTDESKVHVKLVDFGIAKLIRIEGDSVQKDYFHKDSLQKLTNTGQIFGTPLYMSPEQCMGEKTDARSDIYSLGCTLYESLTGRPPFVGINAMETVLQHMDQEPLSLSQVYPQGRFSQSMEMLVAKMLQKNPQQRYQQMSQVAHDLERLKYGKTVGGAQLGGRQSAAYDACAEHKSDDDRANDHFEGDKKEGFAFSGGAILAALAAAVILISAGSWAVFAFLSEKKISVKSGPEMSEGFVSNNIVSDAFKDIPKFSQGVQQIHGRAMRVFTFSPRIPVGELTWHDGKSAACGTVYIPADQPIQLEMECANADCIESSPDLLRRFNNDDITELNLKTDYWPSILKEVTDWRHLKKLTLRKITLGGADLPLIDKLERLNELTIEECNVDAADLAKLETLQRVKKFELVDRRSVDVVLKAAARSKKLMCLNLAKCPFTVVSLNCCTGMEKLVDLQIPGGYLKDQDLAVLQKIPNLHHLRLRHVILTPAAIPYFMKLRQLQTLSFDDLPWSEADKLRLHRLVPAYKLSADKSKN